jgi:hypothetical protein
MLTQLSPYARVADTLRERGYSVMPAAPGTKVPGQWAGDHWRPMPGWQKYCDGPAPGFLHDQWERWPDAGVSLAHGVVIGLDLDTDRRDVEAAIHAAGVTSPCKKRGAKGWTAYFQRGAGLDGMVARVRWYDPADRGPDGKPSRRPVVELLLHGTQTVLPPSVHPDTGQPYRWITPDTLEDTDAGDLPIFGGDAFAALEREFGKLGIVREVAREFSGNIPRGESTGHDLTKPHGRSVNDRAMEALDAWWPAMGLHKTKQRGPGAWEAVAVWRGSGSGRSVHDRNPNLRAVPTGIRDFGDDRSYTPVDLIMAWQDCSYGAAVEWLTPYLRPEEGMSAADLPADLVREPERKVVDPEPVENSCAMALVAEDPEADEPIGLDGWAAPPALVPTPRAQSDAAPERLPTRKQWNEIMTENLPFPVAPCDLLETGLLGTVATYLDDASVMQSDAGAVAVALPLVGAIMGRAYQSPTNLRTNIYTVALGSSGSGKTSLVTPAKELLALSGCTNILGQDRIASGAGLLQMLVSHPHTRVCFLDEFGHMLQQLGSPGSGAHVKQILSEFTALWSAANTLYTGTAYATREPAQIDCPHLCIFGMATPDQFWRAFGSGALEDGSIARYLVIPIGSSTPKLPDVSGQAATVAAIKAVCEAMSRRKTGNLGQAPAMDVPMSVRAKMEYDLIRRTMKQSAVAAEPEHFAIRGAPSILMRVAEYAVRIALICAAGRDPEAPVISKKDVEIGYAIARWSAARMVASIGHYIADNQQERDVNEVERFIRDAGEAGRAWREVMRRFRRVKTRDLKEIVESLERDGSVTAEERRGATGGPATKVYRGA